MLQQSDKKVFDFIEMETNRQENNIELIASENFVSKAVLEAQGSILTNKYAEGYPSKRYYGGCEHVDLVEDLARERLKELFGAEHANVQPHSGSQANMAVYMTVLEHGDKVLGMSLDHGGHLTHGHPLNFSGISYEFFGYGVDKETELINYDEVLRIAKEVKPKLIVAGASAYSKEIDFARFGAIAKEVGALLMVDMAHIAGLIAAGIHNNPVPHADFVTSTTHKTLRGPRGGIVLCKEKYANDLDRSVFPGMQGGPLMHVIAGKAVAFGEALEPEFTVYQKQVQANAAVLADTLATEGFRIISGGTDTHLLSVDVLGTVGISGKKAEKVLDSVGITSNKNTIPFDTKSPFVTSGIRLGAAAMTTRGFGETEFALVGKIIAKALRNYQDEAVLAECKASVLELTGKFPLYK